MGMVAAKGARSARPPELSPSTICCSDGTEAGRRAREVGHEVVEYRVGAGRAVGQVRFRADEQVGGLEVVEGGGESGRGEAGVEGVEDGAEFEEGVCGDGGFGVVAQTYRDAVAFAHPDRFQAPGERVGSLVERGVGEGQVLAMGIYTRGGSKD